MGRLSQRQPCSSQAMMPGTIKKSLNSGTIQAQKHIVKSCIVSALIKQKPMVPRGRLELPRQLALPPQDSVSTNSTIWAREKAYTKESVLASVFYRYFCFWFNPPLRSSGLELFQKCPGPFCRKQGCFASHGQPGLLKRRSRFHQGHAGSLHLRR